MWGDDMHYVFLFILVSNIFPPPFISVPVPFPVPVPVLVYARMRSVLVRLVVVGVRACMRGYGLGGCGLCPRGCPAAPVWGWVRVWVGVWVRRACGGETTRALARACRVSYKTYKSIRQSLPVLIPFPPCSRLCKRRVLFCLLLVISCIKFIYKYWNYVLIWAVYNFGCLGIDMDLRIAYT